MSRCISWIPLLEPDAGKPFIADGFAIGCHISPAFPRAFAMDAQASTPKNFQLVHQLTRRIRIMSPILKNDQERGYIFEILLKNGLK